MSLAWIRGWVAIAEVSLFYFSSYFRHEFDDIGLLEIIHCSSFDSVASLIRYSRHLRLIGPGLNQPNVGIRTISLLGESTAILNRD